jgi:hypothetical protein
MPTIMEPSSSDEPRADELPENQLFAEPFTDDEAVEAKMALMAREVFKSQDVTPKQALLIAQKVLATYPLVGMEKMADHDELEIKKYHYPGCSYPNGSYPMGLDPEECGFCAAYYRKMLGPDSLFGRSIMGEGIEQEDPLDFRWRG